MSTAVTSAPQRGTKARPTAVSGDFYDIGGSLDEPDRALVAKVRAFAEENVAPIINEYWSRAEFPFQLVPKIGALGIGGLGYQGYGCAGRSNVVSGFVAMELATADSS